MDSFHFKSMTAYGRAKTTFPYGQLTVEIQSVNRRFLEVNTGLPRLFMRFEMLIRKKIAESVGRGMVQVSVNWKSEANQPVTVIPNLSLAKSVKLAWEKIIHELGLEVTIPLDLLAREKDLLLFEEELPEEEVYQEALMSTLEEALSHLVEMKEREGKVLAQDLRKRLDFLIDTIEKIQEHAAGVSEKYRQKLSERMEELFSGHPENEERVLREVAVFAERADITEEIVRFKSHLKQFLHESRGKTLDFLIQELLREVNTIGSKSQDSTVSKYVVRIKSELERMREQVQNIE